MSLFGATLKLQRKIIYGVFEHFVVLVAGNIAVKILAAALAVTHFPENPSVGRGYSLNRKIRSVGVKPYVHTRVALNICVLCGDLAVCYELFEKLAVAYKPALAVGYGYGMYIADIA